MKIPTISLKKTLEVTINDALKRLTELDGLDKKALTEKDKDWIQVSEGIKAQPHVFYANQINIEQL